MATKPAVTRKPRTAKIYPDEQKIESQLEALATKIGKREPTEAETAQRKDLRKQLGTLKFKRLAQTRTAKAITAIRAVAKLSGAGYTRTAEQVAKISTLLTAEIKAACDSLNKIKGEKASVTVEL